jgi:hypothetical protein
MKYDDNLENNIVNGTYVGVRVGSPLGDALSPEDDGYNHLRETEHFGTPTQDAQAKKD